MNKHLQDYRKFLIAAEQQAQADFDKTVLSLSGGALGVSFAFVTDIVGSQSMIHPWLLFASWIAWGASVTCILASFYVSQLALRQAIKQVDANQVYDESPGGYYSQLTMILNALGGLLFLAGIISIVIFVNFNLR